LCPFSAWVIEFPNGWILTGADRMPENLEDVYPGDRVTEEIHEIKMKNKSSL